jgi:hypothetical protein
MEFIANILMIAGTFGAAIYCYVLSARLKRFATLETGMGGAIAVLSAQVDDMTQALDSARAAAVGSAASLEALTGRSELVAAKLEILMASMHDLPEPGSASTAEIDQGNGERKLRFMRRRAARDDLEAAE